MKKIFAFIALICGFNLATAQDSIQVRITADYTNANTTTNQITGLKHARIMNMLNYRIINTESNQWKLGGNSGSNSFWLGTNNNFPLIFRTNNTERGRFSNGGLFGLGTASPAYLLDVDARALGGNPLRLQGLQAGTASADSLLVLSNGVVRRIAPATSLFGSSYWSLVGNTLSGEASIGSLNNHNVIFKQNNQERMRLDGVGVNIGGNVNYGAAYTDSDPSLTITPQTNGDISELLVNSPLKSQIVLENQDVNNNGFKIGIEQGTPFIDGVNEIINQTATNFTSAYISDLTENKLVYSNSQKKITSASFEIDDVVLKNGNNGGFSIGTNDNNSIAIKTNNQERLRVLNNGNIGIGTNAPTYTLDLVAGQNTASVNGLRVVSSTGSALVVQGGGITNPIATFNNVSGAEQMRISSGGNVGIGITAPLYKLDIDANTGGTGNPLRLQGLQAGATSDSILTSNNGVVRRLSIAQVTANDWNFGGNAVASVQNIGTTSNFALPFITNNVERMRISETGNVGIGTNAPATKLEVSGSGAQQIRLLSVGQGDLRLVSDVGYTAIGSDGTYPLLFRTASQERMRILNTGNVIVGAVTGSASAAFEVTSTSKGVLLPRLTTTQINAIASPAEGLEVWNTTLKAKCVYDGTQWLKLSHSTM